MKNKSIRPSATDLAKVNVEILKEHGNIFLRCQICGAVWLPATNKMGQLLKGYWKCPHSPHKNIPTKKEVAYHESGHAVMGHLLGVRVDHATIVPNNSVAGQVVYTVTFDKLPPSQQVMIAIAGPIAEDMVTETPRFATFEDLLTFSESDGRGVIQAINRYRKEVDVPGHYQVATYLLNKHRQSIDEIAQSLLEKNRLTGKEVAEIIGRNNERARSG